MLRKGWSRAGRRRAICAPGARPKRAEDGYFPPPPPTTTTISLAGTLPFPSAWLSLPAQTFLQEAVRLQSRASTHSFPSQHQRARKHKPKFSQTGVPWGPLSLSHTNSRAQRGCCSGVSPRQGAGAVSTGLPYAGGEGSSPCPCHRDTATTWAEIPPGLGKGTGMVWFCSMQRCLCSFLKQCELMINLPISSSPYHLSC